MALPSSDSTPGSTLSPSPPSALLDVKSLNHQEDATSTVDLETSVLPTVKLPEKDNVKIFAEDGNEVIIVDWKGPDDPLCPKNWSNRKRMGATLVVASFTFLSPVSSTMIAPAVSQITTKFHVTNAVVESMMVSIFVLAYMVGPLFLSPASEIYGRRIVLQLSNAVYLVFNLACGFATNTTQMLIFRFLAGIGGSAPMGIGGGVLGDLWRPEERGKASALYSLGPLLGPAFGPVCGGWIAQKVPIDGYRWVFFSTTICGVLVQLVGFHYLKETYAPVLLHRQALNIKRAMGLDPKSDRVQTIFDIKAGRKSMSYVVSHGLVRPFVMFWKEQIIQVLALYMSIIFGIIYITIVSITTIFIEVYHESVGVAATNFVAFGLGFLLMAQIQGRLTDYVFRELKERNKGAAQPEFRLPLMIPASILLPTGLLIYGWSAQMHYHWIAVDIGLFLFGAGLIGNFQAINTYLIDAFGLYAASALAAATFFRSLCGFAFPLFSPYLFKALGYGWGCSLLALVAAIIGLPAGPILYRYGEWIRGRSSYTRN